MENLLKLTPHGYMINEKVTDEITLSIPEDNILDQNGPIYSIFGYGAIFFYKNKKGNEIKDEFLISTKFETKPSSVRKSIHYEGYMDFIYTKESYFDYLVNPLTELKNNEIPVIKDSTNVELMFNKFNGGKFSEYIDYKNQIYVILNNMNLNEHLGKIPFLFYCILIAKGFIDSNGNEYRMSMRGKAYPVSLLQKAMTKDPFSAVTHQDAKTSILVSMADDYRDKEPSDLERFSLM